MNLLHAEDNYSFFFKYRKIKNLIKNLFNKLLIYFSITKNIFYIIVQLSKFFNIRAMIVAMMVFHMCVCVCMMCVWKNLIILANLSDKLDMSVAENK